jgi:hypothetical protein
VFENNNRTENSDNDVKLIVIDGIPKSFDVNKIIVLNSQKQERSTKLTVIVDCSSDEKLNINIEADLGKQIQKGLID